MPEIQLIPPQLKAKALPRFATFRGPQILLSRGLKITLSSLAVVILATAALYVWSLSLASSLDRTNEELTAVAKERDAALESRLGGVAGLTASFEGLQKEHRKWSRLFSIIESRTVGGITFTAFEANEETSFILLSGLAPNYKTIANQVKAFEEEEKLKRVELTNVNLNIEGEVNFTMDIDFDITLLKNGN